MHCAELGSKSPVHCVPCWGTKIDVHFSVRSPLSMQHLPARSCEIGTGRGTGLRKWMTHWHAYRTESSAAVLRTIPRTGTDFPDRKPMTLGKHLLNPLPHTKARCQRWSADRCTAVAVGNVGSRSSLAFWMSLSTLSTKSPPRVCCDAVHSRRASRSVWCAESSDQLARAARSVQTAA